MQRTVDVDKELRAAVIQREISCSGEYLLVYYTFVLYLLRLYTCFRRFRGADARVLRTAAGGFLEMVLLCMNTVNEFAE